MKTKFCPICKEDKPTSEFYKDKVIKDGYRYSCKICEKKQVIKYRFNSIKEAAHQLNLSIPYLSMACNGSTKTAGGFIWKFKNARRIK